MHQHQISSHPTQTTSVMASSHPYTVVDEEDDTDICPVCDGQCICRIQSLSQPAPAPAPSLKIKFTLPPSLIAKRRLHNTTSALQGPPLKKRGRPPKHSLTQSPAPPVKSVAKIHKVRQNLKARAAISKKVVKRRRAAVQSDQEESYSSDTVQPKRRIYQDNFPTFVSASALSSISSTSDSSSSSSDFDSDADSDIQAEEENFIVADIHDKARLRRQLLAGDDPQLKKRSPNWVIRPRKKSVGGSDAEMDIDTDADADDQNDDDQDQDDNDDEEDEPDGLNTVEDNDDDTDGRHHYVGLATGWSEEEDESSFDADLFFANLSDSSSTTTSSTRRRSHSYTPGGIDADQSSSTSESPTRSTLESLPFEVTENWDGQLIFTNGESESRGIVDINFEKDTERFIITTDDDDDDDTCSFFSDHLNYDPRSTTQLPESSDIGMFSISDADAGYEEDDGGADEGDTTDEELVGDDCLPNERAMRLFTLPMPMPLGMSAINPMSTVSPSIGLEKRRHTWRGIDGDGDQEGRKRRRRRLRLGTGPRAADILAGKVVFWGDGGGYASSSSASSDSIIKIGKGKGKGKGKHKAFFSPSPSPPSSSHADYQRPRQIPSTPHTGVFIPTGKTRQAVIGDDKKGADVPSPHPRFNGRRSRVSVVQYLLKKHLEQSQSPVIPPPSVTTNSASSPSTPSPFRHLLSSAAASPSTVTEDLATSNTDEYGTGRSTPCPAKAEVDTTCIVKLDDVLEASFLDDSILGSSTLPPTSGTNVEDSSTAPTTSVTTSSTHPTAASAAEEASNKHLTRWDVISIGAFRQTREQQQQQTWGPGGSRSSSAVGGDYGGVIKSSASAHAGSPLSALLWQNAGSSTGGTGSSKKTSVPASISASKTSRSASGSSTKAAKRRKLMMASSMSSPLVLPLSSTSLSTTPPSKSHSSSSLHSQSQSQSQPKLTTPTTHKNRKELRREKRLLKRKTHPSSFSSSQQQASQSSPQPSSFFSYGAHPNNNASHHHQFHTHQHYPNAKTRGTSSSQRMGFFGGAVPPLNL